MEMITKAQIVFEEVSGFLKLAGIKGSTAESITNEFVAFLRNQPDPTPKAVEEYMEGLLENHTCSKEAIEEFMGDFSMMAESCLNSCNKCFRDLDGNGTLIALGNGMLDKETGKMGRRE
ncbi:MAG: hypothetical protein ABIB71_02170 [Candidatus Woesearchaeota archaeon]